MRRTPAAISGLTLLAAMLLPTTQAAAEPDLAGAVTAKIGTKTLAASGTEVNVMRTDGADWAFGAGIAKAHRSTAPTRMAGFSWRTRKTSSGRSPSKARRRSRL